MRLLFDQKDRKIFCLVSKILNPYNVSSKAEGLPALTVQSLIAEFSSRQSLVRMFLIETAGNCKIYTMSFLQFTVNFKMALLISGFVNKLN